MRSEAEEKALYEVADRGLAFQEWRKHPATAWLLEHLRDEAQQALKKCGKLSPFTQAKELADAQAEVAAFETLILKIDKVVQVGISAEHQLEHPEEHSDT